MSEHRRFKVGAVWVGVWFDGQIWFYIPLWKNCNNRRVYLAPIACEYLVYALLSLAQLSPSLCWCNTWNAPQWFDKYHSWWSEQCWGNTCLIALYSFFFYFIFLYKPAWSIYYPLQQYPATPLNRLLHIILYLLILVITTTSWYYTQHQTTLGTSGLV